MKALRRPLMTVLKGRSISSTVRAAQVAQSEVSTVEKHEEIVVNNVHLFESDTTINRISMIYNAGSRYEDTESEGVTHAIRAGLCVGDQLLNRMIQCNGNLSCTLTRDHLIYSMEAVCLRPSALSHLFEAADSSIQDLSPLKCYMSEITNAMKRDTALLYARPHEHVIELLHKAAYRTGGLGNSLYSPLSAINGMSYDKINNYTNSMFNVDNLHLVVSGVDENTLQEVAQQWTPLSGKKFSPPPSKYKGGEVRSENSNEIVHAAVCMEGAGLDSKDRLTLGILQHVMGTTQRVKYNPYTSLMAKAVTGAAQSPFYVTSLNIQHSDSGLFGFQVAANYREVGQVLKAAMGACADLTKGKLSDEDFNRAKKCLLVELLSDVGSDKRMHETFSTQLDRSINEWELPRRPVVESGAVNTPQLEAGGEAVKVVTERSTPDFSKGFREQAQMVEAAINKISKQDVEALAKKQFAGKPSMSAVGNLRQTPYLDEMF